MNLRQIWRYVTPHWPLMALGAVLAMAGSLVTLAVPWLVSRLLVGAVIEGSVALGETIALLLGALLAMAVLNVAAAVVSNAMAARVLTELRLAAFRHLQLQGMEFHDTARQGDLLALLTYEVSWLSGFISGTLAGVPSRLLTAAGAVVLMFAIDPVLALLAPVLVPAFYLTHKLIGRRLRVLAVKRQEAEAELVALAGQSLEMISATKSFTREEATIGAFSERLDVAQGLRIREANINAFLEPATGLVTAVAAVLMLTLAGSKVQSGMLSPQDLFSLLLYAALLTRPVGSLAALYGQYQAAKGTLARLDTVMNRSPEPGYAAARAVARANGAIAFENLRFAYPGRGPTLEGASLAIGAGEIVALTGENGAGKSTLVSLLLRFYDPHSGRITLDGQDIAGLQVQALRRQIGFVPQRPLLFNGTIRANIAFGLEGVEDGQIEKATHLAQAQEFIAELPEGLDTVIGDHGVRLSGGQRQRVALARALVKDPPVLVLDEATSMYDLEGEAAFVEACRTALDGRTVIIITHRPASLALAHRVVEVRDGRIFELNQQAAAAE